MLSKVTKQGDGSAGVKHTMVRLFHELNTLFPMNLQSRFCATSPTACALWSTASHPNFVMSVTGRELC